MHIVLASSSPRRNLLLTSAGFTLKVIAPHIDETVRDGEAPEDYVKRLAKEKSDVKGLDGSKVVVAADTTVVLDSEILGKPANEEEARAMLGSLSGRQHEVLTGFAVRRAHFLHVEVVKTKVVFRHLTAQEIESYVNTKEPLDKAGAYGIQGIGSSLIDQIHGSFTNVIGLPLKEVLEAIHYAQKA